MNKSTNKRVLVAKYWFDPKYNNIVKKGSDAIFRVEYQSEKRGYKGQEFNVYYIVHEATDTEIAIPNGFNVDQPTFWNVLEYLIEYGLKVGTLNIS